MAVSLNHAPLVIPKRKVTNVRLLGKPIGQRETITGEMSRQSIADLEYLIKAITIQDTEIEIRKDNEPTRLIVDNREGKALSTVKRKSEVIFGNFLDTQLIKFIQRSLMSSIKSNAVSPEGKELGTMAYWTWAYSPKAGQIATPVRIDQIKSLPYGSMLILRPRSPDVGLQNMFAARKDAGWPAWQWRTRKGRSGGKGFMFKGINRLKRSRLMKNYTIHITFTDRFKVAGEKYSHGTPVVVMRAQRNKRYRRIRIRR